VNGTGKLVDLGRHGSSSEEAGDLSDIGVANDTNLIDIDDIYGLPLYTIKRHSRVLQFITTKISQLHLIKQCMGINVVLN